MKANRTGGDPGGRGCGRVFWGSVRTGSWSEIPWTTRSSSQRVLLQNDHKSARIQANTTWLDMILYFQSAVGGRFCSQLGKTNFLSILTAQQPPVEKGIPQWIQEIFKEKEKEKIKYVFGTVVALSSLTHIHRADSCCFCGIGGFLCTKANRRLVLVSSPYSINK